MNKDYLLTYLKAENSVTQMGGKWGEAENGGMALLAPVPLAPPPLPDSIVKS